MPVVPAFSNHLPVRVRFGDGEAEARLPEILAAAGGPALVVLDAGLEDVNPAVASLLAALDDGVLAGRVTKPAGEPTDAMVDDVARAIGESDAALVVAIGGGSVIDTAKAARLCVQQGTAFLDLPTTDGALDVPAPEIGLVAVPSTAGTGSEVSGGAVITDSTDGRKEGIAHPNLRADHALVDPTLTFSVPPAMTAYTGVDALAQAIAGMVARCRTPIGDAIALEAVRLGYRALPQAYADGADVEARSRLACASLLAGLTMNISDCAAEHSFAQAIASRFPAPHGLTIGLVIAETLERERRFVPGQLERVADAMGIPDDGSADGSRAVAGMAALLERLDFPVLGSLGIEDGDLDELTGLSLGDHFVTQSEHPWSHAEARGVFATALERVDR